MTGLFAVAWLLKLCINDECALYPAPSLYACQSRAEAMVESAPEPWKLTAECIVLRADKAPA